MDPKQIIKPIALISGANKGIGFETAKYLVKEKGYFVFIGARDITLGKKAREEIGALQDTLVVQLDVSNEDSIKNAVQEISKRTNSIDVLVNNAAIAIEQKGPTQTDIKTLKSTFDVNFYGAILLTQAVLPLLRAGKEKNIVNVSSDLGSLGLASYPEYKFFGNPFFSYGASKTALNAFTVHLANELRSEGFKVNSANPGFTATDLNHHRGIKSAKQAGEFIGLIASLPIGNIPTGSYFNEDGVLPF